MLEVFREAVSALERGESCLVATVVRTSGSTPQKPGAKLLVRQDGSAVGTLGGGCVEGDIWFAAREMLRDGGGPRVSSYVLNEELAARDGLVCGGTMYFLMEPLREAGAALEQMRRAVEAYAGASPVAIAHLVRPPAGSGLPVGSRLFVGPGGDAEGSLGDPALDGQAVDASLGLMAMGRNRHLSTKEGAHIFVEAYTLPPTLVLMGGGHISRALAGFAEALGYRVYVVDDRPEFANPERFPMAEATIVAPYDRGLEQVPVGPTSAIVIATRGHRYDDMATEAAVRSGAGYVGLVGSKRKSLLILAALYRKGVPEERVSEVRTPAGLDIGGRTPAEIAFSIMAEVQMARYGADGRPMRMDQRLLRKAREKALAAGAAR